MDLGLDWPSLDLDLPVDMPPNPQFTPPEAPETPDTGLQADGPRSRCVQQLSALAADIDGVYNYIPPGASIHVPKDSPPSKLMAAWSSTYSQTKCLEQLFVCTQRLIDVYPGATDLIFLQPDSPDDDGACGNPDCIHLQELPAAILGCVPKDDPVSRTMDTFLLNLLLVCHSRVNDIIEVMLSHVQVCAKAAAASKIPGGPPLEIPELRVGSFVASPESSSAMQALLLDHIASVLTNRAKNLTERVAAATEDYVTTKQAQMYRLQTEVLAETAASRHGKITLIRDVMTKIGVLR